MAWTAPCDRKRRRDARPEFRPTMRLSVKTVLHTAIFVLISVALLVLLFNLITVADLTRLASKLTLGRVAFLGALYALMAVIRGVRLGYILGERNYGQLTAITAIHAFLNHVLPFRLGELSLPLLIRGFTSRGFVAGSLALVIVRLYDLVSNVFEMTCDKFVFRDTDCVDPYDSCEQTEADGKQHNHWGKGANSGKCVNYHEGVGTGAAKSHADYTTTKFRVLVEASPEEIAEMEMK